MTQTDSRTTMSPGARHGWVTPVLALAGAALTTKAGLIIGTGNGVGATPTAVLYLCGLLLATGAAVGVGLRRRSVTSRVLVTLALVMVLGLWVIAIGEVIEPLGAALLGEHHWVRDETPVGLLGLVLLGLALADLRGQGAAQP